MQLRTFMAKDMREAVATVRAEMGDEAVIVGSQKTKHGGVMVRAAFDRRIDEVEIIGAPAGKPGEGGTSEGHAEHREAVIRRLRGDPPGNAAARTSSRPELLALLLGHRAPRSPTISPKPPSKVGCPI
jgi:flagellar biosynthesis protein FlhF